MCLGPDLHMGITFAIFQYSGNMPEFKDKLNNDVSDGAISAKQLFKMRAEMLSGPGGVFFSLLLNSARLKF
jgi:hypothetical protein